LPKWKVSRSLSAVGTQQPTAAEAREAIARAAEAKAAVRRADRQFRPRLLAIAGVIVGFALLVEVFRWLPRWGVMGPVEGLIVNGAMVGAIFVVVTIEARQRAYSRGARLWFSATIFVFIMWGLNVERWSFSSGWMAYQLPPLVHTWHAALSAVVATIPLLLSALLIGLRR
jgi:hypothetical protein